MKTTACFGARAAMITVTLAMLTSGCTSNEKTAEDRSGIDDEDSVVVLSGTDWRLVEFQSMSDEVGIKCPDDPSLYTLSFGTDGKVLLRLNCNRGRGSWSATPSSSSGGSIEFGPVAITRVLCPPPSMDEQIARDLKFVRSYMIKEDRLFLSLMADGGIYVWERVPDAEQARLGSSRCVPCRTLA